VIGKWGYPHTDIPMYFNTPFNLFRKYLTVEILS